MDELSILAEYWCTWKEDNICGYLYVYIDSSRRAKSTKSTLRAAFRRCGRTPQ
jgi:hypothetical protein